MRSSPSWPAIAYSKRPPWISTKKGFTRRAYPRSKDDTRNQDSSFVETECSNQLTRGYSNVQNKTNFHLHLFPSTGARFHSFLAGEFSRPESDGDSRFDLPEVLSLALPGFIHS